MMPDDRYLRDDVYDYDQFGQDTTAENTTQDQSSMQVTDNEEENMANFEFEDDAPQEETLQMGFNQISTNKYAKGPRTEHV